MFFSLNSCWICPSFLLIISWENIFLDDSTPEPLAVFTQAEAIFLNSELGL